MLVAGGQEFQGDWLGLLGVTKKSPEGQGIICSPADGRRPEGG